MQIRRSRMRRTRTGKRVALTRRDIEVFRWLARYRYLRSTYLQALVGGASVTRFKERLGDLFHEGFIDRPDKQWEFAQARCQPAVYEIGEGAKRVLHEGGGNDDARTYLAPTAHRQFSHSVMICECLASIELATLARPGLRFIPWAEILARAPEATRRSPTPFRIPLSSGAVIPDGIFGLEYRSEGRRAYRFFALEADRGTMPIVRADPRQTSLLAKLALYREVIARQLHKHHLGVSTLLVLTVMLSEERLSHATRLLMGQLNIEQLLFSATSALVTPSSTLFAGPWVRAGMPSFRIDERRQGPTA